MQIQKDFAAAIEIVFNKILHLTREGLLQRFSLTADMGTFDQIGQKRKSSIELRGANAITLVLAIFIASVGLNVNSAALSILAILAFPLMGPVVGSVPCWLSVEGNTAEFGV